jgi:two-component system phosphate regulon response regulator OmpR
MNAREPDDAGVSGEVILLAARAQKMDAARGFDACADDHAKKPFGPQELRARVQTILERR